MIKYDYIPAKMVRQVLILLVLLVLGYLLYSEMTFMLGAFLGAIALYMLLRLPMFKMVYKWHWPKWLAALTLILTSLVVIILPMAWVVDILITKISPVLSDTTALEAGVQKIETYFKSKYNFDLLSAENVAKIPALVTGIGGQVVNTTLSTLTNLIIMYFILWFMLVDGGKMERWVRGHLPLKHKNGSKLINESKEIILSNTIGIPVLGILQGIVAIIGYLIFDVENPVLWGLITGISSVVPFVGTMVAWVPLTIYTFATGDANNGYGLALWGLIAIGGSDNVLRFILQKYIGDIHPLITVFGVIVGLNLFGFLGLIFGPLLISVFILLVKIYYNEFVELGLDESSEASPPPKATPETEPKTGAQPTG